MSNNPNEPDDEFESEEERILELGEEVWSWSYDGSNSPAGSAWGAIYRLGDRYAARSDLDLADNGPFDSLEEALERSGLREMEEYASSQEAGDELEDE